MNQFFKWSPQLLSVLRIVSSLLFITHGTVKIFDFPVPQPGITGPLPPLMVMAGLLEVVGGGLLVLGLFTRPVAFVLSGMMAVAYFMADAPSSFYPALNMGDAVVLFCFVFLYLAAAGGGLWSLDALRNSGARNETEALPRRAF